MGQPLKIKDTNDEQHVCCKSANELLLCKDVFLILFNLGWCVAPLGYPGACFCSRLLHDHMAAMMAGIGGLSGGVPRGGARHDEFEPTG